MKCLLFDNYDSFTYNLRHMLLELGLEVDVRRNDRIAAGRSRRLRPDRALAGPRIPSEAGLLLPLIGRYAARPSRYWASASANRPSAKPSAQSWKTSPKSTTASARTSVSWPDEPLFDGLGSGFRAGRYHSWVVSAEVPDCLEVTATDRNGLIMGLRHKTHNLRGIQFHPESVLTPQGKTILENWITKCNR